LLPDEFVPRRVWTPWQKAQAAGARVVGGWGGMGFACWLGSVFFMAGYFHLVSPIALLANVVAVPIAFCILGLGLFSLITGTFALSAVTMVVNHANWFAAKLLIFSVEAFALVPRGHLYVEWPRFGAEPVCELVSLDVGEGSAVHVRASANDWLIDAGHERDYERVLLPYLRTRGVNRIDGLLLTHGDSAHVGGANFLLEGFAPRWVGDTFALDRSPTRRALHLDLAKGEQGRRFFKRGDIVPLSRGVQFQVLYPPADWPRALADDKAMVLRLDAAGRRVLFVSDIGFSVEQWFLRNEGDLRADILVKGWPERDHSGTADFISAIRPQAIICAAPKFGTGSDAFDAWAEPMRKRGIQVFNQADCGAVRVRIERDGTLDLATWK
jgi:competence protein ComEC